MGAQAQKIWKIDFELGVGGHDMDNGHVHTMLPIRGLGPKNGTEILSLKKLR